MLTVNNLTVAYLQGEKKVKALKNFSLQIEEDEAIGLVGESGSGKTTLALSILRLLDKRAKALNGEIIFFQDDLLKLSDRQMIGIRGKKIALIPQASQHAFNPVLTIGYQFVEHLCCHFPYKKEEARVAAISLLQQVDLPEQVLDSYSHQLSGGMRQRVAIAMALAAKPQLVIADECTNSLDALHQEQIIQLLGKLRKEYGFSLLVISHDLSFVARTCEKIAVLQQGEQVEVGITEKIMHNPSHAYTQKLLSAFLTLQKRKEDSYGAGYSSC